MPTTKQPIDLMEALASLLAGSPGDEMPQPPQAPASNMPAPLPNEQMPGDIPPDTSHVINHIMELMEQRRRLHNNAPAPNAPLGMLTQGK